MKILLFGNPFFLHDFKQLGHDTKWAAASPAADITIGPFLEPIQTVLTQLPAGWFPDLIVLGDDSTQPMVIGLESLNVPLAWYAIDSHLHASWHQYYAAVFDIIFVGQKQWAPLYAIDPDRQLVSWQPLFCHPVHDRNLGLVRDIPLSFVGTLNPAWNPDRVELIRRLQARYPIDVRTGAYVEPFNRSMMVLNQSVAQDVNFRTFQAMACGALLVTERVGNGFAELFQDGVHCAVYEKGNVEQIIEIAEYYHARPAERTALAFRGSQAVMAAHTSLHRVQALLDLVATEDLHARIGKRRSRQAQIQWCLASVYESAAQTYHQSARRAQTGARRWFLNDMAGRYQGLATVIRRQLGPLVQSEPRQVG